MNLNDAVEKLLDLLEEYYCVKGTKYREAVKNDLRDYLIDLGQDVAVALFEEVKRRHPTQYKEPPCVAVFVAVLAKYEGDIYHALENDGQGIRLKGMLRARAREITERSALDLTEEEKKEIEETLDNLKKSKVGSGEKTTVPAELDIF